MRVLLHCGGNCQVWWYSVLVVVKFNTCWSLHVRVDVGVGKRWRRDGKWGLTRWVNWYGCVIISGITVTINIQRQRHVKITQQIKTITKHDLWIMPEIWFKATSYLQHHKSIWSETRVTIVCPYMSGFRELKLIFCKRGQLHKNPKRHMFLVKTICEMKSNYT